MCAWFDGNNGCDYSVTVGLLKTSVCVWRSSDVLELEIVFIMYQKVSEESLQALFAMLVVN